MQIFRRPSASGLLVLIVIFEFAAFLLLGLSKQPFDANAILMGSLTSALLIMQYCLMTAAWQYIDRYILIVSNILAGIGMIMQYRLSPENAVKQIVFLFVGMLILAAVVVIIKKVESWEKTLLWIIGGSILFLVLPFAIGTSSGGALNWINLGIISIQPSEFVKISVVFVASAMLSKKQKNRKLWPLLVFMAFCLAVLAAQRDLGAALLYAGTVLIMFYVATNNLLLTGIGVGLAVGGAVGSYKMFSHVRERVEIWRNPWADYNESGFQIVQGLIALASGGLFGMGLTRGSPNSVPVRNSDYIFAVICEEFGLIFGIALLAFFLVFIIRGASIAMRAQSRFHALLAFGCTCLLTLQSFIIVGGVIKLIPLTGITLPLVSYGGSSMLSTMILIGIIQGVAQKSGELEAQAGGRYDG